MSRICVLMILLCASISQIARAEVIWIEGENPTKSSVTRHPWWYDKVQKDQLSGGDYISNWDDKKSGEATYIFTPKSAGSYEFWVRANPVDTTLTYQLNGTGPQTIDTANNRVDLVNIAEGNALDIRMIAWFKVGRVNLREGSNSLTFVFDSKNNHHGSLDCFVLSTDAFEPHGILKPGEQAAASSGDSTGWFAFNPSADPFKDSPIDLRSMNEKAAGDGGFIGVKNAEFVHSKTSEPIRFWGVNGPPNDMKDPGDLARTAQMLAKHGVNLVRVHGGYFDDAGNVDPKKVQHAIDIVDAMKAQGIYCHFSIYFYQWFHPKADNAFLKGYDGSKPPTGALFFNPDFQKQYREWWKALLLTPGDKSGKRLIDDPAVMSAEVLNEDSCFFWTFSVAAMPAEQRRIVESKFADFCKKKYESLDAAVSAWAGVKMDDDAPALGVLGIRPLWNIANERTQRDKDTAEFFVETQRNLYHDTAEFLHGIGFKGLVTASNWTTADAQYLGALERYSYTPGDFIDRHGYFDDAAKGDSAEWSIRDNQTFTDRDALRFDPKEAGKPRMFSSQVMDTHIDGKPSMLSETSFDRPNRYRSEGPLYFAAYGSLQASNSIETFALDGGGWNVKPGFFMQPWTVMSPATMGQFPAASLIYRQRLIDPGALLADIHLKVRDLLDLKGQPRGLDGVIDESQPVSTTAPIDTHSLIDPLLCFTGQTAVHFEQGDVESTVQSTGSMIDRAKRTVTSSNGQLSLDYENGILRLNAPCAQGVSGNLAKAGNVDLADITLSSPLDLANIIAVSLDGQPISKSARVLLQVATEERATGFQTRAVGAGRQQILNIGRDPWLMKNIAGTVGLKRSDADQLTVTALDGNGYAVKKIGSAREIPLDEKTLYYLISK